MDGGDEEMTKSSNVAAVYILHVVAADASVIKIGWTGRNWEKRLADHGKQKFGISFDVQPLCVIRGTRADESAIHNRFAQFAINGSKEEFRPEPPLLNWIRWLRNQYFAWVPDDETCEPLEMLDQMPPDFWMPQEGRETEPPEESRNLFHDFGPLLMPPREITIDDFYTSPTIIEPARAVLGSIDLDPASHPLANRVVDAKRFFTLAQNGLSMEWSGNVWLNPPFSEWESWVKKIVREWGSGRINAMIVLCATRTLTAQYFHPIHENANAICIFRGRIAFWGGRATPTPDEGHAVFYFGQNRQKFADEFNRIGTVYFTSRG